eukprot:scaffold2388_cov163-Amphora_coffeaeformis.AAC.8
MEQDVSFHERLTVRHKDRGSNRHDLVGSENPERPFGTDQRHTWDLYQGYAWEIFGGLRVSQQDQILIDDHRDNCDSLRKVDSSSILLWWQQQKYGMVEGLGSKYCVYVSKYPPVLLYENSGKKDLLYTNVVDTQRHSPSLLRCYAITRINDEKPCEEDPCVWFCCILLSCSCPKESLSLAGIQSSAVLSLGWLVPERLASVALLVKRCVGARYEYDVVSASARRCRQIVVGNVP